MKRTTFSTELRWAIERSGMSEGAFARHIDMSPTYLSRILNQENYRPSPEMIRRFAGGLGLPVGTVAGWSDIPGAMGLGAMPEAAPAQVPLARDSDRLSVAEMVRQVEAWPGEQARQRREANKARMPREAYEQWCIDLYRMWEGNLQMVLDLTDRMT
jgi:transcriptional regulator with XRE-family HTH domain